MRAVCIDTVSFILSYCKGFTFSYPHMTRNMHRKFQGTPYVASGIEVLVCSNCDEEFVTAEMQERIESFRPEVKEKEEV